MYRRGDYFLSQYLIQQIQRISNKSEIPGNFVVAIGGFGNAANPKQPAYN